MKHNLSFLKRYLFVILGISVFWSILYYENSFLLILKIFLLHFLCGLVLVALWVFANSIFKNIFSNSSDIGSLYTLIFLIAPIIFYKMKWYYQYNWAHGNGSVILFFVLPLLLIFVFFLALTKLVKLIQNRLSIRSRLYSSFILIVLIFVLTIIFYRNSLQIYPSQKVTFPKLKYDFTIKDKKVAVLGFDGATWDIIIPMIHEGRLPNLARLMRNGSFGNLIAKEPLWSPVLWTTIFSGKNPDKHGIDKWSGSTASNRKCNALWNIMTNLEKKSIVVNVPGAVPPEAIYGYEIAGFPVPMHPVLKDKNRGWLYTNIKGKERDCYTPIKHIVLRDRKDTLEGKLKIVIQRKTLADRLSLSNYFIDKLRFRGFFQKGEKFFLRYLKKNKILKIYRSSSIKRPIAELKRYQCSDWINIGIDRSELIFKFCAMELSDNEISVYVTPFRQSSLKPYFAITQPPTLTRELTGRLGYFAINPVYLLWIYDKKDKETLTLYYELDHKLSKKRYRILNYLLKKEPDWTSIIHVFSLIDGMEHVFWKFMYPDIYDYVNPEYIKKYGHIVEEAYELLDLRLGELVKKFDRDTLILIVSDHGFGPDFTKQWYDLGSFHKPKGIYLFSGPDIKKMDIIPVISNQILNEAIQVDILPTILYSLEAPIGKDMDGKVITNIFEDDFLTQNEVKYIETYDNFFQKNQEFQTDKNLRDNIKKQLRSIGYLQ